MPNRWEFRITGVVGKVPKASNWKVGINKDWKMARCLVENAIVLCHKFIKTLAFPNSQNKTVIFLNIVFTGAPTYLFSRLSSVGACLNICRWVDWNKDALVEKFLKIS